mgnify:CR=1 FL=1
MGTADVTDELFGHQLHDKLRGPTVRFPNDSLLSEVLTPLSHLQFRLAIFGVGRNLTGDMFGNFLLVGRVFWFFDPFEQTLPDGVALSAWTQRLGRLAGALKEHNRENRLS